MIGFRDASTLAFAKLHSRRILLFLTILTSSLLFGSLYAGAFVVSGAEQSMKLLVEEAHGGHYLVRSSPVIPQSIYPDPFSPDTRTISELNSLYIDYMERSKKAAKEAGIPFDQTSIRPPLKPRPYNNPALPADKQLMIDFTSPVYSEYSEKLLRDYAEIAPNTKDHLKTIASKYAYIDIYSTVSSKTNYMNTTYLKDGHENLDYFLKDPEPYGGASLYGFTINSVKNSSYQMFDDSLLQNWLLYPNEKRKANTEAVPVVITTKEAINLFGNKLNISQEPPSPSEKIKWMRNLREKINGQVYESCFRNDSDRLQIVQALNDLSEIKANEKNREYVVPDVVYELPVKACGALTIKRDTRTLNEKKVEQNRIEAEMRLNADSKPQRGVIKFQIVGVIDLNERSFNTPQGLGDLANNLLNNNLDAGAMIPRSLYEKSDAKAKYDNILFGEYIKGTESTDIYTKYGLLQNVLSFNDLSSARQFIKNEGCQENVSDCNKFFRLDPFGSNYLLLGDLRTLARNTLNALLPITAGIAGAILIFTMSRVIIDSRRETAVFRALGAKRIDIVVIYITYSVLVSLITLTVSILVGIIISMIIQVQYGGSFTAKAHVAYGLFDSSTNFSFIGISYALLTSYSVSIIFLGIFATILPLFRNVRRNPIADMRED